jgi:fructose-1,6-bisphosphatase I
MSEVLAGDIGGTKTRLARFEVASGAAVEASVRDFPSREHGSLEEIVSRYMDEGGAAVAAAAFGIAGPIVGRTVRTTNLPWVIDADEMQGSLEIPCVTLLNDLEANELVLAAFGDAELVAAIVSEEMEQLHSYESCPSSPLILCIDPLDGSGNTELNHPLGTVFALYRRERVGPCREVESELLGGRVAPVAAGYVLYGPSTMLVVAVGQSVDGFTLDHGLGEFLLSHPRISMPDHGLGLSADLGRWRLWEPGVVRFVDELLEPTPEGAPRASLRNARALVADFHRVLLEGGLYLYPSDPKNPKGKIRLLYESAPLAFVAELAGGRASTGRERILDLRPDSVHARSPLAIGSAGLVDRYERRLHEAEGGGAAPGDVR